MKKLLIITLTMMLMFVCKNTVSADTLELVRDAESAILIEASTGTVLYEKNATTKLPPASMTKIMTMYLVLEAIDNGRLSYDEMVTVSEHAASMGGSQIYLEENEQMSVEDLLKSVAIASANDAAVALAEKVGGSETLFVKLMNDKATSWNLTNTHFVNPNGLPEENHYSSSYDMSYMGMRLISDFPHILDFTSIYEDYVRTDTDDPFWLVNTNKLIKYVPGVDGLKTGWTPEAGYCLTATMNYQGMRVIATVMGASTSDKRNQEITQLMNYGVNNYEVILVKAKESVIRTEENILLSPSTYNVVTKEDIRVVIERGGTLESISYEIIEGNNNNDDYGILKVYYNGKLYDEIGLTTEQEITRASFWDLLSSIIEIIFVI